jgi:outer membrane protein, multidrug efflux system
MNRQQTIAVLKTSMPASYPSPPEAEGTAGGAALPNPRPASSRGEGHGAALRCWSERSAIALAFCVSVSLFAGCVVGPNYSRPTVMSPTTWKESKLATNSIVFPAEWWKIFNDTELDSLETQAVEANQDLKRAMARVTEARALARVSKSELFPNISAGGAYSRNRLSENRANAPLKDFESDDFSGSFDHSYELDIWGRVRRSVEAANAEAAAVATDLEVVLLTLTADVARNYYFIRSLDNERLVIEATIALRRDTVQLQETRNQAGLINEVDVTRARTELANVEAELHVITRLRAQIEHALAVLCGQPPANFKVATKESDIAPPEVPAGLPSELLQRRPDVLEAEQLLQASSARIGVAKAAFFPTIKLTSTAGLASADLGLLFNGASRVWSIGPSIHVPIFEGGRNNANLKAAESRYEQSVASYRGTILNAFREVEDALSDLTTLSSQSEAVNRALLSARDTAALANERYQRGLSSYLDVVDAQRIALQAERQQTQLHGQRAISTILLAKALGGGWEHSHQRYEKQ